METITTAEMAAIDVNCEYHGLSRLQLMENAGKAIAEEIEKRFKAGRIAIFAGLGNNGGDAFVAARHLKNFDVEVFLLGKASEIKTDIAMRNFEVMRKAGVAVKEIRDSTYVEASDYDVIIDAMLGTGVRGRLRQPYAKAVEAINSSNAYVVAVDVPTGLNPDTGEYDLAVKADLTVTFHKAKPGLLNAKELVGELVVKSIGIPPLFEMLAGPGDVRMVYRRQREGHKGTHGRVLVVGGGPYTGAPALAALAAYAAGADIVTLAVPKSVYKIVASFSPDLIVRKLEADEISLKNVEDIQKLAAKHHVVVMGMGAEGEIKEVAEEVLKLNEVKKAVLDAGAILPEVPEGVECILTPHRGEFRRVFGFDASSWEDVKKAARKAKAVVLLKAPEDVISDGVKVRINRSGNAGMTVGGTGDVLAGIAGAFLVHGNALWAASAAALVNGLAGDVCFEKYGYNYRAMHVMDEIPGVIKEMLEFA
ncbi:bifunctional ADP-dependent NAD(P)H-hydrate dehydratase/NAD(P)H-hydrate epimerase [Archaeoglobus veneficus]|uniref:Bifunctional NAD(P)H-hydrate repair enzyme n=1 Tax=Archaeoglobus veneficus (strain DSM 11195 / SNP6) TaxID=693661 RepID=F2KNU1_ARCVS|nr:bifunctional ADP-dependent NAD(P)H-hydrate dehydratase/NAD(P)H-hydrate epimerase [Archaeoglobus veneficus]AEA47418.1 YjeF-related protein [Archaeoglobus veneficus SNP6]